MNLEPCYEAKRLQSQVGVIDEVADVSLIIPLILFLSLKKYAVFTRNDDFSEKSKTFLPILTLISTTQANSRLSSFFSWISGNAIVSLVPQGGSCPHAPWFAYFALHVEELHTQGTNGLWREVIKELTLMNGKPSVDNALKARPPHSHCSLNGTDRHALLYLLEPISAALNEIDLVISSDCDDSSECSDVPEPFEMVGGIENVVRSDHSGSDGEPDNDLHQATAQQTSPRHRRPAVRVPPPWSLEALRIFIERDQQSELIEVRSTVSAWKQCERERVKFACVNGCIFFTVLV
ncbi:Ectopic P granules protein 5 [Homalodisca vitripennis]|nr:Ectopic P granules protein 5 [Homalodisca vitripennis]